MHCLHFHWFYHLFIFLNKYYNSLICDYRLDCFSPFATLQNRHILVSRTRKVPHTLRGVVRHVLPCVLTRWTLYVRTFPSELGSPLGGRVCVQHAAPLHPTSDGVHASQRLLLQAAAASVDALLDPKH